MPKDDPGYDPAVPARLSAVLMRELADQLEKRGSGWALVIVVKDGKPSGYVAEATGLLPEHIKAAMAEPYDVNVVTVEAAAPADPKHTH